MCNIAFYSAARGGVNVYAVNDRMSKRGMLPSLKALVKYHCCGICHWCAHSAYVTMLQPSLAAASVQFTEHLIDSSILIIL
jgi:hypothetical protein